MSLKDRQRSVSNRKRLFWLLTVLLSAFIFCWHYFIKNSISIKCLFKSSSAVYDTRSDTLTQRQFIKLFQIGLEKITYKIPYKEKPEVTVIRKSPDAHLVIVEEIYSDHFIVRKTDAEDFTGDDYEWIAKGSPLYPLKEKRTLKDFN